MLSQAPSLHGVKVVAPGARQFVDGPLPAALDVPGGLLAAQEGVLPVRKSLTAGVLQLTHRTVDPCTLVCLVVTWNRRQETSLPLM